MSGGGTTDGTTDGTSGGTTARTTARSGPAHRPGPAHGVPEEGVPPGMDADVIVIGSGFGGSVAALRLAEKGYQVVVLEAGRRFPPGALPRTSWNIRRYLWAPRLGCHGFQKFTMLGRVLVLSGAAVGGGSVVYANTLYRPLEAFYTDPQWGHIADWRDELAPYYDQAERMLGVVPNPTVTYTDEVYRAVAEEMGVGHTFKPSNVGVFFGRNGGKEPGTEVEDPYFGGAGPTRTGCRECGECMTGCRWNAKNTLDHNYLYLAERLGAQVFPDTQADVVRPLPDGGYEVGTVRTGAWVRRRRRTWRAGQVVFAGGTLGTVRLLLTMRDTGVLRALSPRVGVLTRTNSESIIGATRFRPDERITKGVAITSSFYPAADTHIEPVRYGRGSNAMALLATLMTDGGRRTPRWLTFVGEALRHPLLFVYAPLPWRWSERTMISLVMQSRDNSLTVVRRRGLFGRYGLTSKPGHGEPNPTWIPAGNDATRRIARRIGGFSGGTLTEILDIPLTAHILGGAAIGDSPSSGVVDPYQRVFGYDGLHVTDGAAIAANLGVNPSLTIVAQAERAMSMWPNNGERDQRPPIGSPYRRIPPVRPVRPAVPDDAPAAYRIGLPLAAVRSRG
ncbi:GMC family oxidoreductase [Protofrankia symbiont of Coriaria ruscifolia]|uniref:FAD-dependent oxidoreductase n=1 Tax=Protofrankia symbiont of Coriaria ruscifolia TaxID=1306542 RepID=UPI001040FF48